MNYHVILWEPRDGYEAVAEALETAAMYGASGLTEAHQMPEWWGWDDHALLLADRRLTPAEVGSAWREWAAEVGLEIYDADDVGGPPPKA